jgi:hypothetical protein
MQACLTPPSSLSRCMRVLDIAEAIALILLGIHFLRKGLDRLASGRRFHPPTIPVNSRYGFQSG